MRLVAVVQARMGSTRLPGKVMKDLASRPVLVRVLERVAAASGIDAMVVATTTAGRDDVVAETAERFGAGVFRGSEDDVLDRYLHAARAFRADAVMRITADCPMLDPAVLSGMAVMFRTGAADYLSNSLERSLPRGLDAEIFTLAALERAWREAGRDYEREHVTPYIYAHPEIFRLAGLIWRPDRSAMRWTLDTPEDYRFISEVYARLGGGEIFGAQEVLSLLEREPHLASINADIRQKELGE